jgi:hypothetical protein
MKKFTSACLALHALGAVALAAQTPGDACEAAKLVIAAKYATCRIKVDRKVVFGSVADYSRCDDRYATKWAAAEARSAGACPSSGDLSTVQAAIAGLTQSLASSLAGGPPQDCSSDLAACASDLDTCSVDLSQTQGDLTTCDAALASCQADLAGALACGNAVIDGGEQCDQANLNGRTCVTEGYGGGTLACGAGCRLDVSGCSSPPAKMIFASSELMSSGYPNFVYPEGADARCQSLANAVGSPLLGRTFKALICGGSPDVAGGALLGVRDRFTNSLGGYVDRVGTKIANDLDDLLDGTIASPIIIDEYGSQIVIGGDREYAWTGCHGSGAAQSSAYLCGAVSSSWTSGHVGTTGGKGHLLSVSGGTFLDAELEACSAPLHLICVEQ